MDGGAWMSTVRGVAKSQTWLSDFTFMFWSGLTPITDLTWLWNTLVYCFPTAVATNFHKRRVLRQSKWAVLQSSSQKSEIGLPGIRPSCQQSHVFSGRFFPKFFLEALQENPLCALPSSISYLHSSGCVCIIMTSASTRTFFFTTEPLVSLLWKRLWLQYAAVAAAKSITVWYFLKKAENRTTMWPTTGHIPWENHNSNKHRHLNVHYTVHSLYNSQDMETAYKSINIGMDKEDVIHIYTGIFSSVLSLSHVWLFVTLWIAARQASLSITNSRSLLKLMFIESVMPSSHLILCCPLLLLPPFPPSIRVFSNESTFHMRWPQYWSFSFNISPSNEHPGLISFGMDWLDLLAVQGALKSLLQHHSSKASIFQRSAFFMVQLSHPYMTTGKTIALTRRTFVGKVMPLLSRSLQQRCGSVVACCRAGGTECSSSWWDLLKEVTIIFTTSTTVWTQVNSREGTHLHPSTENWIKDLLNGCWILSNWFSASIDTIMWVFCF